MRNNNEEDRYLIYCISICSVLCFYVLPAMVQAIFPQEEQHGFI